MNNSSQEQKDIVITKIIIMAVKKEWNIYQLSKMIGKTIADTSKLIAQINQANPVFAKKTAHLNWPQNITAGHIYTGSYSTPVISNPALYKIDTEIRLLIKNQMNNPDFNWLDKAKELLVKKHELSLTTGGSLSRGVRLGILKPGMHVFAKPILGKPFCEIFLPESTKQYLFHFENAKRDAQINVLKYEIEQKQKNPAYVLTELDKKKLEYIERFSKISKGWFSKEDAISGKIAEYAKKHKFTLVRPTKKSRTIYRPGKLALDSISNRDLVSVNSDGT